MKTTTFLFLSTLSCMNLFSQEIKYPTFYDRKTIGNKVCIEPTLGTLIRMIHQDMNQWKEETGRSSYVFDEKFSDSNSVALTNGYTGYQNNAWHTYIKDFKGVSITFSSSSDQIECQKFYDDLLSIVPYNGFKYGGDLKIKYNRKQGNIETYDTYYENRAYALGVKRDSETILIFLKWFK